MEEIVSLQNAKVKKWTGLHHKKERDASGLFLVEGEHLIGEALHEFTFPAKLIPSVRSTLKDPIKSTLVQCESGWYRAICVPVIFTGTFFIGGDNMSDAIAEVQQAALQAIEAAKTLEELNNVKVQYLGKKGEVQALMNEMRALPKEEKPAFGQKVNVCKQEVSDALDAKQQELEVQATASKLSAEKIDVTLPGDIVRLGTTHPLILIQQEIEDLFLGMGYKIAEGPELEQDHYNFELANIPQDHPARDMQIPSILIQIHCCAHIRLRCRCGN
jgi:Phenylalanyl-tRNA synthetase alpha subunit